MLLLVILTVRPQKTTIPVRLRPAQGIELVVAHDGERRAGLTHTPRDMKHLALLRSAIDKIAYKDYLAIPVTKDSVIFAIFHCPQEAAQQLCVTVNIADKVVIACHHALLSLGLRQSSSQRCLA
jgi:hypothetical protein